MNASGRLWATTQRRIAGLLAAVVAATTMGLTSAAPAAAQEPIPAPKPPEQVQPLEEICPPDQAEWLTLHDDDPDPMTLREGARVFAAVTLYRNCSDGRAYVAGSLEDWMCDDLVPELTLWFPDEASIAQQRPYRAEVVTLSDDCLDDVVSFEFSSPDPDPASVTACAQVRNASSQSPGECKAF